MLKNKNEEDYLSFNKSIRTGNNEQELFKSKLDHVNYTNKAASKSHLTISPDMKNISLRTSKMKFGINPSSTEQINTSSQRFKIKKPLIESLNKNSVLSKFRNEMEKNKLKIEVEIEKSSAIKVKHSDYNKRVRKVERLQRYALEEQMWETNKQDNKVFTQSLSLALVKKGKESKNPSSDNLSKSASMQSCLFKTQVPVNEQAKEEDSSALSSKVTSLSPKREELSNKKTEESKMKIIQGSAKKFTIKLNQFNMTDLNRAKERNSFILKPVYNYSRKKTYKVEVIRNWFEKVGLPNQTFSSLFINNLDSQASLIKDEVRIILDNIQFYKAHFISGVEIFEVFRNMDLNVQVKYNRLLEETCGLLLEIPYLILLDFSMYLEKFVAIKPPAPDRLKNKEVKDEESNFVFNSRLLTDISVFIKSCFEVYNILINQVDDMVISNQNFNKLTQFLSRTRYNISSLIMTTKNSIKNMKFDQKNLRKHYQDSLDQRESRRDREDLLTESESTYRKRKPKLPKLNNKVVKNDRLMDISEKIRKQFIYKINEDNQKISRLNAVLHSQEIKETKTDADKKRKVEKKKPRVSTLNSNVMTQLLKYCPKHIKESILSERIIERYKEKNEDDPIDVSTD